MCPQHAGANESPAEKHQPSPYRWVRYTRRKLQMLENHAVDSPFDAEAAGVDSRYQPRITGDSHPSSVSTSRSRRLSCSERITPSQAAFSARASRSASDSRGRAMNHLYLSARYCVWFGATKRGRLPPDGDPAFTFAGARLPSRGARPVLGRLVRACRCSRRVGRRVRPSCREWRWRVRRSLARRRAPRLP